MFLYLSKVPNLPSNNYNIWFIHFKLFIIFSTDIKPLFLLCSSHNITWARAMKTEYAEAKEVGKRKSIRYKKKTYIKIKKSVSKLKWRKNLLHSTLGHT